MDFPGTVFGLKNRYPRGGSLFWRCLLPPPQQIGSPPGPGSRSVWTTPRLMGGCYSDCLSSLVDPPLRLVTWTPPPSFQRGGGLQTEERSPTVNKGKSPFSGQEDSDAEEEEEEAKPSQQNASQRLVVFFVSANRIYELPYGRKNAL